MKIPALAKILRQSLNNEKRYKHSCGVAATAEGLACQYGILPDQAYMAGLLHDCGREIPIGEMIAASEKRGMTISPYDRVAPILLHAALGAELAETKYGIADQKILQSIRLHTVGGADMTTLAKIIYVADMIEPSRDYPGVAELRRLAASDLNKALLAAFDQALGYIIRKQQLIHPDTIVARNEIFLKDFLVDESCK